MVFRLGVVGIINIFIFFNDNIIHIRWWAQCIGNFGTLVCRRLSPANKRIFVIHIPYTVQLYLCIII